MYWSYAHSGSTLTAPFLKRQAGYCNKPSRLRIILHFPHGVSNINLDGKASIPVAGNLYAFTLFQAFWVIYSLFLIRLALVRDGSLKDEESFLELQELELCTQHAHSLWFRDNYCGRRCCYFVVLIRYGSHILNPATQGYHFLKNTTSWGTYSSHLTGWHTLPHRRAIGYD